MEKVFLGITQLFLQTIESLEKTAVKPESYFFM